MSFPYLSDLVRFFTGLDLWLPLPMFGLFVGLAMLVAAKCFYSEMRRLGTLGELPPVKRRIRDRNGALVEVLAAPESVVSDLAIVVLISGVAGARLFHVLEHLDQFVADPASLVFTRTGFSIFGGLTMGALAGIVCIWRWELPVRPTLDAVAPAMMLGYAIGRIGCQVSGDGDWGIAANMSIKPSWWPTWLWAQTYDHNIYGTVIPQPGVYPAPIYETLSCLVLFAALWAFRRHPFQKGWLFALYLLLAGIERLLVEQIRVNPILDFGVVHATQAEMIAGVFIAFGAAGMTWLGRSSSPDAPTSS